MSFSLLDKFTAHLKNVIKEAGDLAASLDHHELRPEHLLYGLTKQKGSIGTEILVKAGLTGEMVKEFIVGQRPPAQGAPAKRVEPVLSQTAKKSIERAVLIANQYEHKYVGTEHLLASLLRANDAGLTELFRFRQTSPTDLQQHLNMVLKNTSKFPDLTNLIEQSHEILEDETALQGAPARQRERGNALEVFCTDLTDERLQESIDPVIGRAKEIERLIHILSRRTKNNPVLIGDPGVGKTAIVEGLAKRITKGTVPDVLVGKRIMNLDLSLVVAGTVYRGEFESRIKQIIDEVRADASIILFIDELHTIIGAGGASGALDAANILKPALAKGHLRCIGATTLDEYHKHIESDAALERRFQPIVVNEPTAQETVEVLRGIKENYEKYHRVGITDGAMRAATELSVRYLQEKFLPDKAIDLIDEAASKMKIGKTGSDLPQHIRDDEDRLAELRDEKAKAVHHEDFTKALNLKREEKALMEHIVELRDELAKSQATLVGKITETDIADVVHRMTGIPVGEMLQTEQEKLLHLEETLKRSIVGQDEALTAIASSIRRARTGLGAPNRPLGSFIFLGPSGVGKTETAKVLARTVFGDPNALIQIDMSEFSESFQASKLIGAPAGYVGYKEGGKLSESVKRKPYSVVLFDEIEKAHPDIFNLLLQILDEGHLTDAVGKKVNFKNTIIIMTSNIGLAELNRQAAIGFGSPEELAARAAEFQRIEESVLGALRRQFRPEFLNRIDKILVFKPLTREQFERIIDLQLADLRSRLKLRHVALKVDASVRRLLLNKGFSADQGARGLRRAVQEHLENPLADYLLKHPKKGQKSLSMTARTGATAIRAVG
ncbi:MAG: ATP-dependent Clp protease ATP-binding subunit [Candidatus Kerfeldbacteria bacterium]|nr:ATP-dependent Clp protease ATP-binding subunit [Candidatus Kerfeldbacteria bacterium]